MEEAGWLDVLWLTSAVPRHACYVIGNSKFAVCVNVSLVLSFHIGSGMHCVVL